MGPPQYPIDNDIAKIEHRLSILPRRHPERPIWLLHLAHARGKRYNLSRQVEDLDKYLLHVTEVILLPSRPWAGRTFSVFSVFFALANILLGRAMRLGKAEDVKNSIHYLCYLRDLPLEAGGVSRIKVTETLVQALASHIELVAGDETPTIQAMLRLCYELLRVASHFSGDHPVKAFCGLARGITVEFCRGLQMESLDQVVDCLREAVKTYPPELQQIHLDLALALQFRFMQTHCEDDYNEAIAILDNIIVSNHLADNPTPYSAEACAIIVRFTSIRSDIERPEYIEEAISRCRSWLGCSALGDNGRSNLIQLLEWCLNKRSKQFGLKESLQGESTSDSTYIILTNSRHPNHGTTVSGIVFARITSHEENKEQQMRLLPTTAMTPAEISGRWQHISSVAFSCAMIAGRTGDIMDIEEAIKYQKTALASLHIPNIQIELNHLGALDTLLRQAFDQTGAVDYLEESISTNRRALKLATSRPDYLNVLQQLSQSLIDRWKLLGLTEDLDESMRLCHAAADYQYASAPNRLDRACFWASHARAAEHPTVLTAYKSAISLMQSSVVFAPTLETQHSHLVSKQEASKMPLEYASYLIHIGQLEGAIEALEQGRALLWSEMRGLRTSIDQLRSVSPDLAIQLEETNRELEALILQSENGEAAEGAPVAEQGTDAFGQIFRKQRRVLGQRETLISRIQELPGFENFLKTPQFDRLRAAASRGPIIMINHCRWRSDILIILHDSPPSLIPTTDDFYDRAIELKDKLLDTRRKHTPGSHEYEDALRSVLKDLYALVGRPVIERLRELSIPDQSRVWWCPTSVFCALPLHAMGPIPSDDGLKWYFLDRYICSYTPTLSALIESHGPSVPTSNRTPLLLVGRPNDNLPDVWREMDTIQRILGKSANSLVSEDATLQAVTEGLRHHQFAHFACHGNLEAGKPFDAWFKLHAGSRLTLLDIVRSRLPTAEFAFLSACHSAELTDKSIADEALHLAAAMQYCGFRSVVGTMWAVVDEDGPEVAKHFYEWMFPGEGRGAPSYKRSARALRNAVQKLRKRRGMTLERWVNFVHYGA